MAIEPNPTLPAAAQQAPVEQDARERLDNASVGSGSASRGGPDMSKGPIAVFNVPKEKQEQEHQRHDNEAAAGVATEIAPAMPYISSSPGPSSGEQSGAEVDAEQQATVGEFPGRRAGLSSTLPLAAGELPPPPTIAGIRLHEEPDATGKGVPSSAGVVAVGVGAGDGGGNEQGRESSASENMNAKQSDAMRNVLNLPDLIITLQDVSYWIPTPRRSLKELMSRKKKPSSGQVVPERPKRIYLLNHITGTIRPKQMTMLMGKSGAGKSTLLDVIAGRKTFGTVEGTLLFNGQPRPHNFRRLCGYVEQTDTLMPTLTPREHFYYTARLRLPSSLEKDEIDDHVSSVVAKLGLQGCADTVVGGLRHRGISGGEAKRVNIGLELITSPTVLFLDEPSSGLDATTAFDIMRVVRKICDDGTGVLCTLHQPSREIWELFHNLVLLSTGGVAFFGPTNLAVPYFTRLGFECLPGKNPAEFVLDVLNSTTPTGYTSVRGPHVDDEFFLKQYTDSRMAEERNYSALATAEQAAAEAAALSEKDLNETFPLFQNSAQHNMKVLLQRSGVRLRRDSNFYVNRLIVPTIVALILLLLYLDSPYDMSGIRNRQSIIMLTVTFFLIGTNSLISLYIEDRIFFTRERNAAAYQVSSYYLATTLVELPIVTLKAFIWVTLVYWTVPFDETADKYFFFLAVGVVLADIGIAAAQFFGFFISTLESAVSGMIIFALTALTFSGFFIRFQDIPDGWIWAYYISPAHYAIAALVISQFDGTTAYSQTQTVCLTGETNLICPAPGNSSSPIPCTDLLLPLPSSVILTQLGAQSGFFGSIWPNFVALIIFWVIFRVASYCALRFRQHGRR